LRRLSYCPFCSKASPRPEITSFLHKLEALPPEKQKDAIESFINASELTQREREIVTLLLKGYTYRLIAQELFISESTVKTHMQNIYFKLNVRNKTELLQKLMK
jgi:DNA-binding CsgD family transcriptional regulator